MKTITITLTDLQWQAMADIVVDPETWAKEATTSKMHSCIEKVVAKEQKRLLEDPNVETIPATVEGILQSHFEQPGYKTRAERRAEELASMGLPPIDDPR